MAKKKKVSKKKVSKKKAAPAPAPVVEEEVQPGVVEEAFIKVRGAGMGGAKMMTQSEYDAYKRGK